MAANRLLLENDRLQDPFEAAEELDNSNGNSDESLQHNSEILFNELNFFAIPSQSNVYGMAGITTTIDGSTKLLVAILNGKIYSLSFNQQSMQSTFRAVGFSYIPGLSISF